MERKKLKTIAFIAARGGSKSIPLKNIKTFCEKPLIYWNLLALSQVIEIDEIYVATDSLKIMETVKSFNFSKVFLYLREEKNAQDNSSTESVMLEFIRNNNVSDQTIFILSQITCPLTTKEDYENAIKLYNTTDVDSILSVARLKRFFWTEDGKPLNYDYKKRPLRQSFKGTLMENGAFYINTVKNIVHTKNRLSGKITVYEMPDYTAIDIDEEEDWLIAEKLMKKFILKPEKKDISLFLSDVDGTLTDAGMYYDQNGNELKKFNTRDGKGFELLRSKGIKTGLITSENTKIVDARAKKLNVDFVFQNVTNKGKLEVAQEICDKLGITLENVAYIGDDINCIELLEKVGVAGCPKDAVVAVKAIPKIKIMKNLGGQGAVREFAEYLIQK